MDAARALMRAVDPPLGLYFRAGWNDHRALMSAMSIAPLAPTGVVIDASLARRHEELRLDLRRRGLDAILDPMAMELALPGGWGRDGLRGLEWAGPRIHTPDILAGAGVAGLVDPIAKFASERGFSAVLSPSHYLGEELTDSAWWDFDRRAVGRLRQQLDAEGARSVRIYYRLALSRKVLMDPRSRERIVSSLSDLPVHAVWLCVHRVGAAAGHEVIEPHLEALFDLAGLGLPLVGEKTGTLGLALAAFGAVGGIESGITYGETFDATRLQRKPRQKRNPQDGADGFLGPRVYIDRLGVFLRRKQTSKLFIKRGMRSRFACQDRPCCATPQDMIENPKRHFLFARTDQIDQLSHVPVGDRRTVYLNSVLGPAVDESLLAAKVEPSLAKTHERMTKWKLALRSFGDSSDAPDRVLTPHWDT